MSAARPRRSQPAALEIGLLAEALVAQWLMAQGWEILQRRWRCRWGELDLVACTGAQLSRSCREAATSDSRSLAFVEVKARSGGSWDANGLLAITGQKQAKLWQTADLFLAEHSHLAILPCRFDVALVSCRLLDAAGAANAAAMPLQLPARVEVGQPVAIGGYRFTLQRYIEAAFDQS